MIDQFQHSQQTLHGHLQSQLQAIIPGARLDLFTLSELGSAAQTFGLYLLNADYPQGELTSEQVQRIMHNPLYWAFCWASGQVLAQELTENPQWVRGKRVLDFGCGSGVVAIAAALVGAREVVACDIDPMALQATRLNAAHNQVALTLADDFAAVEGPVDIIIVADVLYDQGNFHWLSRFVERAEVVLIADSRVQNFDFPPYRHLCCRESSTLPDLDESAQFRHVNLYTTP